MPEINFRVKICGGKRTETEVYVTSVSVNRKEISFKNGAVLTDDDFACVIDNAVIYLIEKANPQFEI